MRRQPGRMTQEPTEGGPPSQTQNEQGAEPRSEAVAAAHESYRAALAAFARRLLRGRKGG